MKKDITATDGQRRTSHNHDGDRGQGQRTCGSRPVLTQRAVSLERSLLGGAESVRGSLFVGAYFGVNSAGHIVGVDNGVAQELLGAQSAGRSDFRPCSLLGL